MHTPGPWQIDERSVDGRKSGYIRGPKSNGAGGRIAVARVSEAGNAPSERAANARLIAAAPALLEALREALIYIRECADQEIVPRSDGEGFRAAERAIAAAEGR